MPAKRAENLTADVLTPLRAAASALAAGDRRAAITALVSAWRAAHAGEIARVLELVSNEAARGVPALARQKTASATHDAWMASCERALPEALPALLEALPGADSPFVRVRFERLISTYGPDPRVSARTLQAARFGLGAHSPHFSPVRNLALKSLADSLDPRHREELLALRKEVRLTPQQDKAIVALSSATEPELDAEAGQLLDEISAHATRLASGPAPTFDALEDEPSRPSTEDEATLLEAIYSAPDDDAPRLVYGDWCAQRGSARGEFIALQLKASPKPTEERRVRALLKAHQAEWLGPLDRVLVPKSVRFERGFLARCATRYRNRDQREEVGAHPSWATVVELTTDEPVTVVAARALRSLVELSPNTFVKLCACPALPVTKLSLGFANEEDFEAMGRAAAKTQAFPKLEHVEHRVPGMISALSAATSAWLFESSIRETLSKLEIYKPATAARGLIDLGSFVRSLPPALTTLILGLGAVAATITHRDRKTSVDISLRAPVLFGPEVELPIASLETLDPRTVDAVTVRAPDGAARAHDQLSLALRRFPNATLSTVV
ncbi:MAG: TIGR02996 domain-containing protein [Polyangiaceae bacterium]